MIKANSFDAAVIGGGPAGLSAAIAMRRRGAKVALFYARSAARDIERFETLQARLKSVLMTFGAGGTIEACGAVAAPAIASNWFSPSQQERPSVLDPHGPSFHVEREAFRSALAEVAADAGVHFFVGKRMRATPGPQGWQLIQGSNSVDAPFLIVATGRDAIPIAAQITRRSLDRLVAVFGSARQLVGSRDLRLVVEAAPNGWWYRCPSREGRQQIVFLSDADLVRNAARTSNNWFATCAVETELGKAFSVDEPVRIVAADTYYRDAVIGDNIILIGDAAMAGDPLGGQGVTWAVNSGLRAAEVGLSSAKDREAALAAYSREVLGPVLS